MASQERDSLQVLEQRRLQLEAQLTELEKLLKYWRTWELEYELFKEEISAESATKDAPSFTAAAESFHGSVLNAQEVKKLLTTDKGTQRSHDQVLDLLTHRIGYVQGNVDSIGKRKDAVDEKLRGIDVLLKPDLQDEEGLPLVEITEELDEDDNVISSSTKNTNESATALLDKLESQGLTGDESLPLKLESEVEKQSPRPEIAEAVEKAVSHRASDRAAVAEAIARAKADELAAELDDEDEDDEADVNGESAEMSMGRLLGSIADLDDSKMTQLGPGLKMKDPSNFRAVPRSALPTRKSEAIPAIPDEESPEDAAMRREMLQYSMNEVGAVVAEMQIEEDDDDDDEYDDDDYDEEDEEDQFGRSTKSLIDEEYRREMLDLEKQLNAKALQNMGPAPGRISPPSSDDGNVEPGDQDTVPSRVKVLPEPAITSKPKEKKAGRSKGVRFAEDVNVADEASSANVHAVKDTQSQQPTGVATNPLADEISERQPQSKMTVDSSSDGRKVSRFKAARASSTEKPASSSKAIGMTSTSRGPLSNAQIERLTSMTDNRAERFAGPLLSMTAEKPRYTPEGPEGKTHADVLERAPESIEPVVDEHGDAGLSRQALASEHFRQRNRQIYRQGGFQADEPAEVPIDENGKEVRPRMSRFKAARMGKTGQ